jgi:hypothetical protein
VGQIVQHIEVQILNRLLCFLPWTCERCLRPIFAVCVTPSRFPPPWSVEEPDACFIVRDTNRQARAYVYFEEECRW